VEDDVVSKLLEVEEKLKLLKEILEKVENILVILEKNVVCDSVSVSSGCLELDELGVSSTLLDSEPVGDLVELGDCAAEGEPGVVTTDDVGVTGADGDNANDEELGDIATEGELGDNANDGELGDNANDGELGDNANDGELGDNANDGELGDIIADGQGSGLGIQTSFTQVPIHVPQVPPQVSPVQIEPLPQTGIQGLWHCPSLFKLRVKEPYPS